MLIVTITAPTALLDNAPHPLQVAQATGGRQDTLSLGGLKADLTR
jgi:hypothetical protein